MQRVGKATSQGLTFGSPLRSATTTLVSSTTRLPVIRVHLFEFLVDDASHLPCVFVGQDSDAVSPSGQHGGDDRDAHARVLGEADDGLGGTEDAVFEHRINGLRHGHLTGLWPRPHAVSQSYRRTGPPSARGC